MLDGRETLNLASFVTTWMEPQAEKLIHDTLRKNHIDHEEYPAASLDRGGLRAHAGRPLQRARPDRGRRRRRRSGRPRRSCSACSPTSAAWRNRRRAAGLPTDRPNVVFGAETHVVWDKFANYFDVEMRKIPMKPDRFVLSARRRRGAGRREHHRRRRGARHHPHRRGRPDRGDQRPAGADQGREGLGHPAARRRCERRVHRPVRRARPALGLPPRAGRVDQRVRAQVRPGLPGRRLADLPGRVEAARGPRVQRELPRRRAADVHVQLLARARP